MKRQIQLHKAPWLQNKNISRLFNAYAQSQFEIRVVGGCVRDTLYELPIKDWDLATDASPEQSIEICRSIDAHVIETGLKHGTITAIINSEAFEITTLRNDLSTDGRHAEVTWVRDWETDAMRRDFTINALYGDAAGNVIDYTGGIDDLENNIVRFIGDPKQRITEDYLRIMRFFRFMGRYGSLEQIDEPSLLACTELHPFLTQISSERIRDELWKIFITKNRAEVIELMVQIGIFKTLQIPLRAANLHELNMREQQNGFNHSPLRTLVYLLDPNCDWHCLKKRFALSNKQARYLHAIHEYHPMKNTFTISDLQHIYYYMQRCFDQTTAMQIAQDVFILNQASFLGNNFQWQEIYIPPFPVTGKDLIEHGLNASKEFGEILKRLEDIYIDSHFSMDKAALLKQLSNITSP